jgi:hypothetical protein
MDAGQPDVASPNLVEPDAAAEPVPRPLAPLSTATVTFQLPTLRWELATGTDGVEVQICHDRACTTVEQTLDVTGTQARPKTPLSSGVHFWRLYGRAGTTVATTPGPTWELFVGARSAAVDTSWGTVADFNGDGYADLLATAVNSGTASIYFGGASGLGTTPTTLTGPTGSRAFGISAASAGDLNGDGYADLVVGSTGGTLYIYLGGATGLSPTPTTLTGPTDGSIGISEASAGDLNGDGYGDLVVAPSGLDPSATAYVYFGSATGLSSTPMTLTGPAGGSSYSVAGAGDVNGDGYADVIVGAASDTSYVYLGGANGPSPTPATTLTGPSGTFFGFAVAGAGDVNGDGFADVVVGTEVANIAYLYLGSATGLGATPITLAPPSGSSNFGVSVAGAGDVNGDGYADLVVGDDQSHTAYVYLGGATGLGSTPTTLTAPSGSSNFGEAVASAGDLSGGGYADLVVGSAASDTAYVYLGGPTGVHPTPTTLSGPSGSGFGSSLARAGEGSAGTGAGGWRATRAPHRSPRAGCVRSARRPAGRDRHPTPSIITV